MIVFIVLGVLVTCLFMLYGAINFYKELGDYLDYRERKNE